jgi:hypothetical protein
MVHVIQMAGKTAHHALMIVDHVRRLIPIVVMVHVIQMAGKTAHHVQMIVDHALMNPRVVMVLVIQTGARIVLLV